jgi:glycosyltransferase involved in cell wall biosynthesis
MKVLVISHAHPDFSVGGAEIAAYNLFRALDRKSGISEVTFLARTDHNSIAPGMIMVRRDKEYLWRQDVQDWFRLRTAFPGMLTTTFREFLLSKSPDVVFAHHFAGMGVEILKEIRRTLPHCRLVLTLHEYMSICLRNGQMVKNTTKRLCYRESPEDCHICFPEYSPQDFWMRKHYIQRHFECVDAFISPSEFLKSRYVDWGIPQEHIFVIENGQPTFDSATSGSPTTRDRVRFGFFGQITEYKGADLLLHALHQVPKQVRAQMVVEIHGANLEQQGKWLQDLIEKLRTPLIAEGCLRWVGPYEPRELFRRMSKVDWVVIPSIWWENSPMVIQEAFCCRRPVIAANIGGMAEKVTDRVTGLHFEARNPLDLADVLGEAATSHGLWERLVGNIRQPISYDECAEKYLQVCSNF